METEALTRLFTKIDKLIEDTTAIKVSVAQMPCKVHEERFKSQESSIMRIWGIIVLLLGGIVTLAIKALK